MKNRYNVPSIPNYTPKAEKPKEVTIQFNPCLICGKEVTGGHYGTWNAGPGNNGTCSRACEASMTKRVIGERDEKDAV